MGIERIVTTEYQRHVVIFVSYGSIRFVEKRMAYSVEDPQHGELWARDILNAAGASRTAVPARIVGPQAKKNLVIRMPWNNNTLDNGLDSFGEFLVQLGETIGHMHDATHSLAGADELSSWYSKSRELSNWIPRELRHKFEKWLSDVCVEITSEGSFGLALLHRDIRMPNIVRAGSQVKLIDWEGAAWGPPIQDLVRLQMEFDQGAFGNILAAYNASVGREVTIADVKKYRVLFYAEMAEYLATSEKDASPSSVANEVRLRRELERYS